MRELIERDAANSLEDNKKTVKDKCPQQESQYPKAYVLNASY